jgi:hypothetical protein
MKHCRDCICYECMYRDDCPENLCDERDCYKRRCNSYEPEYDWKEQEHEECEN